MHISRWWVMWLYNVNYYWFQFFSFCATKKIWRLSMAAILNFRKTLKKSLAHLHIGECDIKIWIISDFRFWSFCARKKIWSWPPAAISNFGSIFKKSFADPRVARNVMLKFQKNWPIWNFLRFYAPQKIKIDLWRPFWISVKPLKSHLYISISCDSKIWIIKVLEFLRPQNFLELTSGGHFEFW